MGVLLKTAMIIDDDEDLGQLLSNILGNRKINTLTVNSLPEAEKYLNYLKPTVVFLDNNFPEGLGVNFIHHIKSADEDIKIVMMTADTNPLIEEKATKEGVNYFIKKPISTATIDNILDDLNLRKV